jgi:hypothetical protein
MVHTSTLIHSRFPYPYPSFLLHEFWPHDDHIYVHVYVDVLHERQVAKYADLDCTLPIACEYVKSNPRPCASNMRCIQLRSYDAKSNSGVGVGLLFTLSIYSMKPNQEG